MWRHAAGSMPGAALLLLLAVLPLPGQTPDELRRLVHQMSLEEKIALVHGVRDPEELGQAGYWPGLPRLGIGPLRFADGPSGVNANRDATAMPAPVGLAATFDVRAARLYGETIAREARALRTDVLLAPHVNIVRDPTFHRNHTTLGEDPLLAARIAAAEIDGIQSQGVMAQVKHLACYNGSDNVAVDERTLHEIYLPAFEAAVRAGVASVMCSYNRINGHGACESGWLQNDVLRRSWGFDGFITSDWGAVHTPFAIAQGIDLEMPGRPLSNGRGPSFGEPLQAALAQGEIPASALDAAVEHILAPLARFHRMGSTAASVATPVDVEASARAARAIATRSAVLVKNENAALPLGGADLASLALIGPTAGQLASGFLGERGYGFEDRLVSPLDALRRTAPNARVRYAVGVDLTGTPIPAAVLKLDDASGAELDFAGARSLPPSTERAWTGTLTVAEAGEYTLLIQPAVGHGAEGGGSISIDGHAVARTGGPGFGGTGMAPKKWSSLMATTDGRDNGRGTVTLSAGPHRIELKAHSIGEAPLALRFAWITPEARRAAIDDAAATARAVRTPVVFAWSGAFAETLPDDQDELIARVAAANPRTVVVLNASGPVFMPWADRVRAVLVMWYPGQEGGWATADLLLGRANPAGKLPVTFPARLADTPAHAAGHPERLPHAGPPGSAPRGAEAPLVTYSEGIAVGYRWYDQERIAPLFPFGHGLSYTRFEYSDLAVRRTPAGAEVRFTLRNAGALRGTEVAQVYLGAPEQAPVAMAPRALAGFEAVELAPGERRTLTMELDARAFSYWSAERHGWRIAPGSRQVSVGASSRDIRLTGELR
jgi:beta-glucosidase